MSGTPVDVATLGKGICEVLGLAPGTVQAITIHLEAGHVPCVTVKRMVLLPEAEKLCAVLQEFKLEPK